METASEHFSGSPVEVRAHLARILASPEFRKARQLRLLLEFLVERTLSGESSGIREFTVATGVFGRDMSFDSTADNIVRVEIRRLRDRLNQYYQREGWLDTIRIDIPKGSYVPRFVAQELDDLSKDRTLAGHIISATLARNPDGVMFRAVKPSTGRSALLWLTNPLENAAAVLELCRQTAMVVHPRICVPQEIGLVADRVFMLLDAPPGELLTDRLNNSSLPPGEVLALARDTSEALSELHAAGFAFGSLRPECVVLPADEGPALLMLLASESRTHPDDAGRSPEQRQGADADSRSDIWALGEILNNCRDSRRDEAVTDSTEITLDEVLGTCRQANPERRYASAGEMSAALSNSSIPAYSQSADPGNSTLRRWALAAIFALCLGAVLWSRYFWSAPERGVGKTVRLAVLPFTVLGTDSDAASAGRSLPELLGASLANLPRITVVAHRSSARLTPGELSLSNIRERLNVGYAIEGSILKEANRFTVVAKMADTTDLSYAWTGTYSGSWSEVYEIVDRVALDAAQSLGIATTAAGQSWVPRTHNPQAFEAWSRGHNAMRDFVNNQYTKSIDSAESFLLQALELDPSYVDPMVDLGFLYWTSAFPPEANQAQRLAAAEHWFRAALDQVPDHPLAEAFLGRIEFFRGQRQSGLRSMQRAARREIGDAYVRIALYGGYFGMGFWESAIAELDNVIKLDPLTTRPYGSKAYLQSFLGRFDDALQTLDALPVNSPRRLVVLTLIRLRMGQSAEAALVLHRMLESKTVDLNTVQLQALVAADQGDLASARREIERSAPGLRLTESALLVHASLGNENKLLAALPNFPFFNNYRWLVMEPRLKRFANNPRFRTKVRELYKVWQTDVAEFGPSLPVAPPVLPTPDDYFNDVRRSSLDR